MSTDQNARDTETQLPFDPEDLSEEAKKLLEDWEPGMPIPGGTFYTGLGARKSKPLFRKRTQEERELGL